MTKAMITSRKHSSDALKLLGRRQKGRQGLCPPGELPGGTRKREGWRRRLSSRTKAQDAGLDGCVSHGEGL